MLNHLHTTVIYRLLRIAAIAVGAVTLLLLCAAGIIALTARPNDYKGAITARVHEKFGRTLTVPGDITLRFWPRPGVGMGRAQLSEHAAGAPFATVDGIRLSFALLPLLRGDLVVDRVEVIGAQARLIRLADGSMNIDDLTAARGKESGAASPPAPARRIGFAVESIRVDNAKLTFDDRRADRVFNISTLNLDSGPIEHGVPSRVALSANVGISRPAINTAIILSSGFMLDRDTRRIALTALDVNLDIALKDAGSHAVGKLGGSIDIDLAKDDVNVILKGRIDDSAIDAKVASHGGAMRLAIDIDKLDLGRYRGRPVPGSPGDPATPGAAPADAPAGTPGDTAVDLSGLAKLRANGNLHIGALTVGGLQLTKVDAVLHADAGKVVLSPILATLYGGTGKAALTLDYDSDAGMAVPRISLAQSLHGIELGPLLRDALGKAPISGRGEVIINLHTQGAGTRALRQALSGSVTARLADGSISGFRLPQLVRDVKAVGGTANDIDKTDFAELNASFAIKDGIARNDDLLAKTALLRIAGAGEIDVVHEQIGYTLMCTVVPTLQGQGGADAGTIKGVTVPVTLRGPLSNIAWGVDAAALAADPAVQKLKDKSEKLGASIKDKLRGILRR